MDMNKKKIVAPSFNDNGIISFGLSVITIVFILLGGWMAYAPLASSSVAQGNVSADLEKKTVQHLEGGKIKEIYVKNGDEVKKGQLLIKLSDIQVDSQLDIYKSQLQDALAVYARLQAHIKNRRSISFPEELTDENNKKDQKNIFYTIRNEINNERRITKNKILQVRKQIESINSMLNSKEIRLKSISEEILEWEELYKEKLVDKQKIRNLKRERYSIEGEITSAKAEIAKNKERIAEMEEQQALKEKQFNRENLQQYVKVKAAINDLTSKIFAAQDTQKRTNIIAPIDGTVVGLQIHTVGGIINRGETILEIIPKDSKLLVVVQVQTTDIDKVKAGLSANVLLPAFNLKQIHTIKGRVIYVSADIYSNQQTGAQYYEAKIEITPEGMKTLKENDFVLVPGMPAQAMIQLGERTALSYLVKPFMDMLMRGFNEE